MDKQTPSLLMRLTDTARIYSKKVKNPPPVNRQSIALPVTTTFPPPTGLLLPYHYPVRTYQENTPLRVIAHGHQPP